MSQVCYTATDTVDAGKLIEYLPRSDMTAADTSKVQAGTCFQAVESLSIGLEKT